MFEVAPEVSTCYVSWGKAGTQHNCLVIPDSWGETIVTLLFKKGDPLLWKNYRPIAVVHLFSKMLAILLEKRLSSWTEDEGLRSPAQTGFRQGHSTLSNAYVVQHFADKCKHSHKHLYMCLIDLAKAYDSVTRRRIWECLHERGIQGRILFAIDALYKHTSISIKYGDGTLPAFESSIGVKQGCPLSPLLFGMFIEQLDTRITDSHQLLIRCSEVE